MAKWSIATEESLKQELLEFERRYGIDSFELRRLHATHDAPDHIDHFDCAVWVGTLARWEKARARKQERAAASGS
jgi:hypothetical protein